MDGVPHNNDDQNDGHDGRRGGHSDDFHDGRDQTTPGRNQTYSTLLLVSKFPRSAKLRFIVRVIRIFDLNRDMTDSQMNQAIFHVP